MGCLGVSCKIFPCPVLRDNQIIRCHKMVKSQFCWLHQGVKQSIDTPPTPQAKTRQRFLLFSLDHPRYCQSSSRQCMFGFLDLCCKRPFASDTGASWGETEKRVTLLVPTVAKQLPYHHNSSDNSPQIPNLMISIIWAQQNWYFYHLLPDLDPLTHRFFWSSLDAGGKFFVPAPPDNWGTWNLAIVIHSSQ